jgi:trimethylamine:corrinoid methyltransferase-like protein
MGAIRTRAVARGASLEEMTLAPGVTTIISADALRPPDEALGEGPIAMAEHGRPVRIAPVALTVAMTPVGLPAAMARPHAEAPFGGGLARGGLTAGHEKLIGEMEILQEIVEALRPIPCTADEAGSDAIRDVPPGGHHVGSAHTMARDPRAFCRPMLSDWRSGETREMAGARDAAARATELRQQALAHDAGPPIDPAIREEREAFVARRKEEIGDGEP